MSDYIVNPPSSSCSDGTTATGASVTSGVTYDGGSLSNIPASTNDNLNITLSNIDSRFLSLQNQVYDAAKVAQDGRDTANRVEGDLGSLQVDDIGDPTTYTTLTPSTPNLEKTLLDIDTRLGAVVSLTSTQSTLLSLQPLFNKHISKAFVFDESNDFDLSAVVALSATIANGYVISENGDIVNTTGEVKSFTANKDTYIYVNASTNAFTYKETSVGAGTPASTNDEVILWKITTDGSSITSQTDLREKKPIDESLFRAGTDVSNFIPNDSITNAKIDMSSALAYDSAHTLTADAQIAHKKYVDDSVAALTTSVWTDATTYIHYANTVGIGTSTPNTGTALHVNGTFRLTSSGHAAGKLLQSNSQGDASWVSVDLLTNLQATLNSGSTATATTDVSITRDGASFDSILLLSDTAAKLEVTNGANSNKIEIQGGSMVVTDAINTKGLEYALDYKANFTTNSLVNKAYVDNAVSGAASYIGGYNASTNTPDLDTSPSGIQKGDMYTVTADGTFYTVAVKVGDFLIAEQDNPTQADHWTIVEKNLDFGIANGNSLLVDGTPVATDYAKFTANGLEGRSATEVKTDLSLNNVENTALSTWTGSTNITTLGTIATGVWQGSTIDNAYLTETYALVGTYNANFITRWDATTNTIESSKIQDDGSTVSINQAPNSSYVFYAKTNGISQTHAIYGVHNTAAVTNNYALRGYNNNSSLNSNLYFSAGVFGHMDQGSSPSNGSYAGGVFRYGNNTLNLSGTNTDGLGVLVTVENQHAISNLYGIKVHQLDSDFNISGSTYGLYISSLTGTGTVSGTKYAIYQQGTDENRFDGATTINNTLKIASSSDQQLFLDKDSGNYIRYRTAAGVNRGYVGYTSGGDFNIYNAESSGLNVYTNNTLSIEIDASSNITVPNGRIISTLDESYPFRIEGTRQNVSYSFRDGVTLRAYMGYSEVSSTPSFNIQNNENSPIRLYTNSTERVKIEAAGNVHIKKYIRIEQDGGTQPQAGQFLKATNGQGDAEWATVPSGGATDINGLSDATTPATDNIGLGSGALASIVSGGNNNTALGINAGNSLTTGDGNVFIGHDAAQNFTTSSDSVAIGKNAMGTGTGASTNIAIGSSALQSVTGAGNIGIGNSAGSSITTGQYNVVIGRNANAVSNLSHQIAIGQGVATTITSSLVLGRSGILLLHGEFGTAGRTKLGINLGNTYVTPSANLHVKGNASDATTMSVQNGSGNPLFQVDHDGDVYIDNGDLRVNGQLYSPLHSAGTLSGTATAPDFANGNVQYFTLTANTTLNAPTNVKAGASYTLIFVQGGSGGYNVTFDSTYNFGSAGAPDLTIGAAGDRLYVTFICYDTSPVILDAIFSGIKH